MSSGPGQVVVLGRAQEAEPVGQALEDALREDESLLLGLRLQDLEDQVLLAHPRRVLDLEVLRDLQELRNLDLVECADVERVAVLDRDFLSGRVGKPLGRWRLESLTSDSLLPFRLAMCLSLFRVIVGGCRRICLFWELAASRGTPGRLHRLRGPCRPFKFRGRAPSGSVRRRRPRRVSTPLRSRRVPARGAFQRDLDDLVHGVDRGGIPSRVRISSGRSSRSLSFSVDRMIVRMPAR